MVRSPGSPQGRLAIGVLLLEFASAVQVYAVSALLPRIAADLHAGDRLALLVSGAAIGTFVTLPFTARIVARVGWSHTLSTALILDLIGLIVSVTATRAAVYAGGQLAQGAAAGMLAVGGFGAVIRFFQPAMRARLMALTSAMWIAPALVAPPLAVLIAGTLGWRITLLLSFPLLLAGRLLTGSATGAGEPDPVDGDRRRAPVGAVALPVGVILFVAGTAGAPWELAAVGAAVALVAARTLLPAGTTVARRGLPAAVLGLVLFNAGYFGADALLTILLTVADHASLYEAGAALSAGGVAWGVTSLLAPRLGRTTASGSGARAAIGLAATAAGTLVLGIGGPTLGIVAWAAASAGVGLAYPALGLAATTATGLPAAELATGAVIAESLGALLGRSLGAGLASGVHLSGLSHAGALRLVYVLFAVILALAAVVATRLGPGADAAV